MRINCFIENIINSSGDIVLNKKNSHHLKNVLRVKVEQKVTLFNGRGDVFISVVKIINNNEIILKIISHEKIPAPLFEVDLYQAMPKINRWEMVLQKSVELGVSNIFPLKTKFTQKIYDEKKYKRFNQIIISAAEQSELRWIPKLHKMITLETAIKNTKGYDVSVFGSLKPNTQTFKNIDWGRIKKISLFIGPEGDFSDEEVELMVSNGVVPVTFGSKILRTETAAIFGLSIINYELNYIL